MLSLRQPRLQYANHGSGSSSFPCRSIIHFAKRKGVTAPGTDGLRRTVSGVNNRPQAPGPNGLSCSFPASFSAALRPADLRFLPPGL